MRSEGLFASSAGMEAAHPQHFHGPSQAGSQTGRPAGEEAALKAPRPNLAGEQALWSPAGAALGPRGRGDGRHGEKGVVGTSCGSPWSHRDLQVNMKDCARLVSGAGGGGGTCVFQGIQYIKENEQMPKQGYNKA